MGFLKTNEIAKYKDSITDGTKDNPFIERLDDNYKLALYLGYTVKWDYDYYYTKYYNSPDRSAYKIKPIFKKSYNRFDFNMGTAEYCTYPWWFIMDDLLPKIKQDGLFNDNIQKVLLDLDLKNIFNECMVIINKKVKDFKYPFNKIKGEFDDLLINLDTYN